MDGPKRKPIRLPNFDYSTPGAYFITICTQERKCTLGDIVGGGAFDAPYARLTQIGQVVRRHIVSGNNIPGITVEKFVIMPNHVHIVLLVDGTVSGVMSGAQSPANAAVPHFVSTLKHFCHRDVGEKIFQRSHHEHVIRGERDYLKIWEYIDNNPAKWKEDCFYMEKSSRGVEGAAPYNDLTEEKL